MVNAVLAGFALLTWGLAYGIFFARDLRRWWRARPARRAQAAAERQNAVKAYAVWVSNIPPARPRRTVIPPYAQFPPPPPLMRGGKIVPFPRSRSGGRR